MSTDHREGFCLYCGSPFTEQTTEAAILLHERLLDSAKRFRDGDLSVRAPNRSHHPQAEAKE